MKDKRYFYRVIEGSRVEPNIAIGDLEIGDQFEIEDRPNARYCATSKAYQNSDGVWTIDCDIVEDNP